MLTCCATWISAWSGVPAGVFAPSLAIGAGLGHDVALFMGMRREATIPWIAVGITACPLPSSGVARLVTRPMYQELAALQALPSGTAPDQPSTAPAATKCGFSKSGRS